MSDGFAIASLNDRIIGQVSIDFVTAFTQAAATASSGVSKQLLELARIFEAGLARSELEAIHQDVAREAQVRVVKSYRGSVGRGSPPPYRVTGAWQRYAGGKLLSALSEPGFYRATADEIGFINVAHLNKRAKQWARLNFGAGARGQANRPQHYRVHWGNQLVAVIGLSENARPAFFMPAGYFFDGTDVVGSDPSRRGKDAFYLPGNGPARPGLTRRGADGGYTPGINGKRQTKGIKARNFFDPGVRYIAGEVPRRYKRLYDDLYKRGIGQVRSTSVTITVTPFRPRRF